MSALILDLRQQSVARSHKITPVLHFSGAYSGVVDCLFVRHFSRITALRILPKLGMKLEGDELGTVAEPDFP